MGCGESKNATATENTAINKKSSSSRTNSKERAPLVQQQEAAGNDDTKNPPQHAVEKGNIHIIKEEKCAKQRKENEKGEIAAEMKERKNGEAMEGAKKTIDKAKVEETTCKKTWIGDRQKP